MIISSSTYYGEESWSQKSIDVYRYGFNGMEKDDEVKGAGNHMTTPFRQYDPRIGRWMSLDPLMSMFPDVSPYCAYDNNPIFYSDPYGLAPGNDGDPPKGGDSSKDMGGGNDNSDFYSDCGSGNEQVEESKPKGFENFSAPAIAEGLMLVNEIVDNGIDYTDKGEVTKFLENNEHANDIGNNSNLEFYYEVEDAMNAILGRMIWMDRIKNGRETIDEMFSLYDDPMDLYLILWVSSDIKNAYQAEMMGLTSGIMMGMSFGQFFMSAIRVYQRAMIALKPVSVPSLESAWDVLPTNQKYDAGAQNLATEIGGKAQVRFRNSPREFDAISDMYIGQHKPALNSVGSQFRQQARATFTAAKATGREVYYKFDGKPAQAVIDKLNQYSVEYGVPVTIKY